MAQSRLPLRGIVVFEAIARLGSFKAAATELNLTRSAVSHQIRSFEAELGVKLFNRVQRGVTLSGDAILYAKVLSDLLDRLRHATEEIARRGQKRVGAGIVRIKTPPSLATHWLMPRLPDFIGVHPGVDVRVLAVRTADRNPEEADIEIAYGDAAHWNGRARPLLQEVIQPYCAPQRLKGLTSLSLSELLLQPLIRSRDNEVSWESWFGQRGFRFDPSAVHQIQIDPSYVAIEAAVNGVGVVLEGSILTDDHVAAGRLITPVLEKSAPSVSYWLLPLRQGARAPTIATYDWLLKQAIGP